MLCATREFNADVKDDHNIGVLTVSSYAAVRLCPTPRRSFSMFVCWRLVVHFLLLGRVNDKSRFVSSRSGGCSGDGTVRHSSRRRVNT